MRSISAHLVPHDVVCARTGEKCALAGSAAADGILLWWSTTHHLLLPSVQEVVRDPVVCDDGFSYERTAVQEWLLTHDTSFVTGEPLASQTLVPNRALKIRLRDLGLIT